MDNQEFFLLIPAIIYGVAIVDLLKVFKSRKTYWEITGWGVLLMVIIINTWAELYNKLGALVDSNINFFLIIGQSIVYAQAASLITPEEKHLNTKDYFLSIRKPFFLLMAGIPIFNLLVGFFVFDDHAPAWMRPTGLFLGLACALYDRVWFRAAVLVFYFILAVLVIFVNQGF